MSIENRKYEHIQICLKEDVRFRNKTSGFEKYDFLHCALPEIDFEEVKTETMFLGKELNFPFLFSAMTGGFNGAVEINRQLAEVCAEKRVAFSVGSQRPMIENDDYLESFTVIRDIAPDALVFGNIGAVQLKSQGKNMESVQKMIDIIQADAMTVHLNSLQEIIQPEGETQFTGVLKNIENLVKKLDCPVILKETGCGISQDVARKLKSAGVYAVDVAGAGGTSWAGIESYRTDESDLAHTFWDWGIPTAESIKSCKTVPGLRIIGSGGIMNGLDMAKALALGASLCGMALPILMTLINEGKDALDRKLDQWKKELRVVLFLTGSKTIEEFKKTHALIKVD